MGQYVVNLEGGGSMQVNANSFQDALDNVKSTGNVPAGSNSVASSGGGGSSSGGGGGGGGNGGGDTGFNVQAAQLAAQVADNAAQREYLNAKLNLDSDELAFKKAQAVWQQTFQERQQTFTEGMQQRQIQLQETQHQDQTALNLLQLGSQLRGPQNYLTYLRTLNSTPGGLKDLVSALAGRYQMARSSAAPANASYTPASLQGLVADVSGASGAGMQEALPLNLPSGSQWNARNYRIIQSDPVQLGLLQNLYEESGRDFGSEQAAFLNSLPRYAGPQGGRVRLF